LSWGILVVSLFNSVALQIHKRFASGTQGLYVLSVSVSHAFAFSMTASFKIEATINGVAFDFKTPFFCG
jgi:hypothetical protein